MGKVYNYKGVKVNAFGIPVFLLGKPTVRGKPRRRNYYFLTFESELKKSASKDLIVMYDIPHEKKRERDWFRRQLQSFHYIMIQKSVWVGPSPLPKEFMNYVKLIGLKDKLKTFKLAKPYTQKGSTL